MTADRTDVTMDVKLADLKAHMLGNKSVCGLVASMVYMLVVLMDEIVVDTMVVM